MENATMLFRFDIRITEENYLDLNRFWMLKSPYGKKQLRSLRLVTAATALLFSLLILLFDGFSGSSFLSIIPLWLVTLLFVVGAPFLLRQMLKGNVKAIKKQGKPPFSPAAVMEFYEDHFVETSEDNRTELKYTALESISVIADTTVYLHINSMQAYILPPAAFLSHETYRQFVAFLQTINSNIHYYPVNDK